MFMLFLDRSSCAMAAKKKIEVPAYVAIVMQDGEYGARPLLSGIFTPVGEGNMDESTLRQAGPYNNMCVFTRKFPYKPISHEKATRFYNETVSSAILRYQDKKKRACPALPKLPLSLLSGPAFLKQAIIRKLMKPGTVDYCLDLASNAGQEVPLSSTSSEALQVANIPSLPGSGVSNTLPPPGATPSPQVQPEGGPSVPVALDQGGLDILHPGVPAVGAEVSIAGEEGGAVQVEDEVSTLDDDRVAEDALRKVSTLVQEDQDNPVVKCLVASVKHLEKSNKEKDRKIMALNKLTMTMEMRLQGFQESSADEIAKGLLPKIKGTVTEAHKCPLNEIKKDIGGPISEIKKDIEVLSNLVMENMGATPVDESLGIKTSLARLAGSIADLNLANKSVMGAVMLIDQKLTASGLVIKEDPNTQVNIPEVLVQVRSDQINAPSLPSPPPPPSPSPCQVGSTPNGAKLTRTIGLKRTALLTPLHPTSSFSSLTPSTTPGKKVRWDVTSEVGYHIPEMPVVPAAKKPELTAAKDVTARPAPARSLASQFNSSLGDTPASNPALWKTMLEAQETYPSIEKSTVEQIEKRIAKYQSK